jgi:glycosyltransferase involved in cell wall biosynthesis
MLREAVESVFAQTYRPIEIILVDDGSTDETPAVCDEIPSSHPDVVRVIHQDHRGPGLSREAGRRLVQGEFIQYLDSDDLIDPRKFEVQIEALRAAPGAGIAYCKTRQAYWEEGRRRTDEHERAHPSAQTEECFETLFPRLLSGRCWHTLTPLYRADVVERIGPWSDLAQEEDWEYDARAGAIGIRLAWCSEILAEVRHHAEARASRGWLANPAQTRSRCRAHKLIYEHARRAGIGSGDLNMQRFARELFLLARQCGAAGLADESRELFELAREACGPQRASALDFRIYRSVAALVGWKAAGKLSEVRDRILTRTGQQ